jgi:peptide/nickel transport system substrate-binding protein
MAGMRRRFRLLAGVLAVGLLAAAGCAEPGGGGSGGVTEFPRNETLFIGGQQWGPPSSWNPIQASGQATGTRGLLYETPFVFNPFTQELEPWLAERGEWVSGDEYDLTLREGLQWSDGEPMTAEDVVFTVELGRIPEVPFSPIFEYLESVEAVDELTTRFTFSQPRRGEFDDFLAGRQIVPEHIWSAVPEDEIMTVGNDAGELSDRPIGSGPYLFHSHTDDRMVWERNDAWWGIEVLELTMKPRYIIDLVNPSNDVALAQIVQNQLDLSNFFLPGIQQMVEGEYRISTYYAEPPYMLSANTAYLWPNHTREPLGDAAFRRALAFSIDVPTIVERVYGNIVQQASPTGLLPVWGDYVDDDVVAQFGFQYDPDEARQILAGAGYLDVDGDSFVDTPAGDPIELTLMVPSGWTDWQEASEVIARSAREAGINVVTDFPAAATLDDLRSSGAFDLLLNNWTDLSITPWTNYRYLFQLPIQDIQPNANFGRYQNQQAWDLTNQLGRESVGEGDFQALISQLQQLSLTEMPAIPLWYNGAWSQVNNSTWTNWPSSAEDAPHYYPVTWNGWWEKGAIYMLNEIEPAAQ